MAISWTNETWDRNVLGNYTFYSFLRCLVQTSKRTQQHIQLLYTAKAFAYNFMLHYAQSGVVPAMGGLPKYGIVLSGKPRTGKTGLAAALAHCLVDKQEFLWHNANVLMNAVRTAYLSSQVASQTPLITAAAQAPVLFLDDLGDPLGTKELTQGKRDILYRILSPRQQNNLTTIITTSLDEKQFCWMFGNRIAQRVLAQCVWLDLDGHPLRAY